MEKNTFDNVYADRPNQDALEAKREEYIKQAIEEALKDKQLVAQLLAYRNTKNGHINILPILADKVYSAVLKDYNVDQNTPPEKLKELENEYNQEAIKKVINDYLGSEENIFNTLKNYL